MQQIVIKWVVDDAQLQKQKRVAAEVQKVTDELRKSIKESGEAAKKAGSEGSKGFTDLRKVIETVSLALLARGLYDFTKQVIAVRGEFQKFEAVLTNTLGSKSSALIALARIVEFAKTTPFGVNELTNSFIKLANRGIQPTVKELRALGDLAATLGKSFEQVVEAILDINNSERWREVGIKAKTTGDKVTLSFRGISQEVERTERGVMDAITALGQLNGVAGSTEAISRTLAGQTSNLSDSWEQLLNTIGKGNEGVLFEAVTLLSKAVDKANELLKGDKQVFDELLAKTLSSEQENFEALFKTFGNLEKAREVFLRRTQDKIEGLNHEFKILRDSMEKVPMIDITGSSFEIQQRNRAREEEMRQLADLINIYMNQLPAAIDETIKKLGSPTGQNIPTIKFKIDDNDSIQEYMRVKKEIETESARDPLRLNVTISDEEMDKLQSDAYDFMSKIISGNQESEVGLDMGGPASNMQKFMESWAESWRGFLSQGVDDTNNFLMAVEDAEAQSLVNRLHKLREFYDEQQLMVGDNERLKSELRIKEEQEVRKLQRQIAQAEWEAKRNSIVLSIAGGVARAFIDYQWPYALIPAAAVAAQGAVQLGIADKNRPRFAKGVINLQGPGTETSDSIPSLLSRGESVMTAKQTREAFGILTDVRAGKLNDRVLKQIVAGGAKESSFSDSRIVDELKAIKKGQATMERNGSVLYKVYQDSEGNKKRVRASIF